MYLMKEIDSIGLHSPPLHWVVVLRITSSSEITLEYHADQKNSTVSYLRDLSGKK